jgi:hypothetical protein
VRHPSRALHFWSEDQSIYRLYPTSVPQTDELTRLGRLRWWDKVVAPPWRPTPSMRQRNPDWPEFVPGGDPINPRGPYALYLSWQFYRIHGTHDTRKIGRRSSNGCIGLYNEHIAELFRWPRSDAGDPDLTAEGALPPLPSATPPGIVRAKGRQEEHEPLAGRLGEGPVHAPP